MKRPIFFALLFAAMMIPIPTFPTCIIVIKYKGNVYIAADDLETYFGQKPDKDYCKIRHVGKYYYAFACFNRTDTMLPIIDHYLKKGWDIHRKEVGINTEIA